MLPKKKDCVQDIAKVLRENHDGHTGIVYCCSKKDCEEVAAKLRERGVHAEHYHAVRARVRARVMVRVRVRVRARVRARVMVRLNPNPNPNFTVRAWVRVTARANDGRAPAPVGAGNAAVAHC